MALADATERELSLDEEIGEAPIVAYYRLDPTSSIVRYLAVGALSMSGGSVVMAGAFRRLGHATHGLELDPTLVRWGLVIAAVGISVMFAGGLFAILGLRRVLSEERYLALRTDGALYRDDDRASLLRWEDVESVRAEPGVGVVFQRHDGSRWIRGERYAVEDAEAIAKRAAEVRRKALFGLL